MTRYAVINADTAAKKTAARDAGCTHLVVPAFWTQLQPTRGGALDADAVAAVNLELDQCRLLGLAPILSHSVQYPPTWAATDVEPFTDQTGQAWGGPVGSGKQVRNWMWTALGRSYLADFVAKVRAGLTTVNRAAVTRVRFGGGYFDELQYPPESLSSPFSYWGFGASMQSGNGLASGLAPCPLPGYVPFTGTDDRDVEWINWYLRGVEHFLLWYVTTLKAAGWTVPLSVCHPGFSIRHNQSRSVAGFRQSMAAGHDFTRALGAYKNDPQVQPWSTWINGPDTASPVTVDSDQSAWKKLAAEASVRGKHHDLWGENTGGETDAGLDAVFAGPLSASPASGPPLVVDGRDRSGGFSGYRGLMWLDHNTLTAGGGNASLAHFKQKITGT